MKTTSLTPHPVSSGFKLDTAIESGHTRYYHLHTDIQNEITPYQKGLIGELITFAASLGFTMSWENFHRLGQSDSDEWVGKGSLATLLADPTIYGAPIGGHLTLKYSGLPYGEKFGQLMKVYEEACYMAEKLATDGQTGYLELEMVPWRKSIICSRFQTDEYLPYPLRYFETVDLQSLGRNFRTTEIHLTMSDVASLDSRVPLSLFESGFYSAFRERKETDKGFSTIATIQGFEGEIGKVRESLWLWITNLATRGFLSGCVDLKQEDIVAFCVFGEDPKVQKVIVPGSLG